MKYLVDADWSIDYLTGQAHAQALYPTLLADGAAISVINVLELRTGVHGARDPRGAARDLRAYLRAFAVLRLNRRVVEATARLRHDLLARKLPIAHRAYDLITAGTALAYGLTLVTSNTRDYRDIPGLVLLNSRPS